MTTKENYQHATRDLLPCRGMSEPFAFAFNLLDEEKSDTKRLLIHAACFMSYIGTDDDKIINLATPDDDPRMRVFMNYVLSNYGKKTKERLKEEMQKAALELDAIQKRFAEHKRTLDLLETEIKKKKAEVQNGSK